MNANNNTAGGINLNTVRIGIFSLTAAHAQTRFFQTVRPSVAQARFHFWMWRTYNAVMDGTPLPPMRDPQPHGKDS